MIIDIERLTDMMVGHYAKMAKYIDDTTKSSMTAIAKLDQLESAQIEDQKIIDAIVGLANRIGYTE